MALAPLSIYRVDQAIIPARGAGAGARAGTQGWALRQTGSTTMDTATEKTMTTTPTTKAGEEARCD